jgi:SAM-dependent methyltransferase
VSQRELWNERYLAKGSLWGAGPNQFVAERLADLEPCRVLDLGSGQGRNAIWLAKQGHTVTAVDISDVANTQAAEIAAAAGVSVEFVTADLESWEPPPASFDLVLLAYLQAPEIVRRSLHGNVVRALCTGGRVFLVAHHKENLDHGVGGPPVREILFDEGEIAADFPGFAVHENARVLRTVEKDGVEIGQAIDLVFFATKA